MIAVIPGLALVLAGQFGKTKSYDPDIGEYWGWAYGWRIHSITGEKQWHNGVDLPSPIGTPVYAVWPGVVSAANTDELNGNYIKISHDPANAEGNVETAYAHLNSMDVSSGEAVTAGQKIGEVGTTGRSTGPHLHFIIRVAKGKDIDPTPYLESSAQISTGVKTAITGGATGVLLISAALLWWWLNK